MSSHDQAFPICKKCHIISVKTCGEMGLLFNTHIFYSHDKVLTKKPTILTFVNEIIVRIQA